MLVPYIKWEEEQEEMCLDLLQKLLYKKKKSLTNYRPIHNLRVYWVGFERSKKHNKYLKVNKNDVISTYFLIIYIYECSYVYILKAAS